MNGTSLPATPMPMGRGWQIVFVVVIAGAFTGLLVGLRQEVEPKRPAPVVPVVADAGQAVTYAERPAAQLGPNRDWRPDLTQLEAPVIDWLAEITVTDEDRKHALAERREFRAFDGAPPVVPHSVDQRNAASCLHCHGKPTRISGRDVPQMSHSEHPSCTQCHVEGTNQELPLGEALAVNSFDGQAEPLGGLRAWTGAPPEIPHATGMRSECINCHGPTGRFGLRSTHPWRSSCLQCHAPSAELDQRQFMPPLPIASAESGGE